MKNIKMVAVLALLLLAATRLWAVEDSATDEEKTILSLVLKHSYTDGGYTVVVPETGLSHAGSGDLQEMKQSKKYIVENLLTNGIAVTKLVDQLFERNKKVVRLTLKSSPKDGYLIDYDGKYEKYFKKDGGGWDKWYKENPKAYGNTTVSLPVYDRQTGLVLVYKGTQAHWLAGSGFVILYRYEKGSLKELNKVCMYVS